MGQGAVILPAVPDLRQPLRQFHRAGNLRGRHSLVDIIQRLVVDVLIHFGGIPQIFVDVLIAPVRPVMALEHNLHLVAEQRFRFQDIVRPFQSVPHLRAAQGIDVMHGTGAVLRQPQALVFREPGVHFRRRLRAGGQLELNLQPVDHDGFVAAYFIGRRQQTHGAYALPQADTDGQPLRLSRFHDRAVLILRPAAHGRSAVQVFTDGMLQESLRSQNNHLAGRELFIQREGSVRGVLSGNQAINPAVMVDVGMAVQHGFDVDRPEMFLHQGLCRGHVLLAHQHVEHDPAVIGPDKGRVGHVIAAHLINPVADFKQPGIGVQLGMPPEAGIRSVGRFLVPHEVKSIPAPGHHAVVPVDDHALRRFDHPAKSVLLLTLIRKIQFVIPRLIGIDRMLRRGFVFRQSSRNRKAKTEDHKPAQEFPHENTSNRSFI